MLIHAQMLLFDYQYLRKYPLFAFLVILYMTDNLRSWHLNCLYNKASFTEFFEGSRAVSRIKLYK